jgi:hypothetical protein
MVCRSPLSRGGASLAQHRGLPSRVPCSAVRTWVWVQRFDWHDTRLARNRCRVIVSGEASAVRGLLLASYSPPEHAISPGSPSVSRSVTGHRSPFGATTALGGGGGDTSVSCVLLCEPQKFSARMASRSTSRLVCWPWSGGRNSGRHIPPSRTSGSCVVSR